MRSALEMYKSQGQKVSGLVRRYISRRSTVVDKADFIGCKFDEEVNVEQMLDKSCRNVLGTCEMDGFKARGFNTVGDQNDLDGANFGNKVMDFFKKRKIPSEGEQKPQAKPPVVDEMMTDQKVQKKSKPDTFKSLKAASRVVFKKSREQVSSLFGRRKKKKEKTKPAEKPSEQSKQDTRLKLSALRKQGTKEQQIEQINLQTQQQQQPPPEQQQQQHQLQQNIAEQHSNNPSRVVPIQTNQRQTRAEVPRHRQLYNQQVEYKDIQNQLRQHQQQLIKDQKAYNARKQYEINKQNEEMITRQDELKMQRDHLKEEHEQHFQREQHLKHEQQLHQQLQQQLYMNQLQLQQVQQKQQKIARQQPHYPHQDHQQERYAKQQAQWQQYKQQSNLSQEEQRQCSQEQEYAQQYCHEQQQQQAEPQHYPQSQLPDQSQYQPSQNSHQQDELDEQLKSRQYAPPAPASLHYSSKSPQKEKASSNSYVVAVKTPQGSLQKQRLETNILPIKKKFMPDLSTSFQHFTPKSTTIDMKNPYGIKKVKQPNYALQEQVPQPVTYQRYHENRHNHLMQQNELSVQAKEANMEKYAVQQNPPQRNHSSGNPEPPPHSQ